MIILIFCLVRKYLYQCSHARAQPAFQKRGYCRSCHEISTCSSPVEVSGVDDVAEVMSDGRREPHLARMRNEKQTMNEENMDTDRVESHARACSELLEKQGREAPLPQKKAPAKPDNTLGTES